VKLLVIEDESLAALADVAEPAGSAR